MNYFNKAFQQFKDFDQNCRNRNPGESQAIKEQTGMREQ